MDSFERKTDSWLIALAARGGAGKLAADHIKVLYKEFDRVNTLFEGAHEANLDLQARYKILENKLKEALECLDRAHKVFGYEMDQRAKEIKALMEIKELAKQQDIAFGKPEFQTKHLQLRSAIINFDEDFKK